MMVQHSYSAANIEFTEFDASVRERMGMYFRVGPGDPRLPECVMSAVAGHALHPAAGVAEVHSLRTVIEINSDLGFTITMDQQHAWGSSGRPAAGFFDSLLGPEWLYLAASAALSEQVEVEMWSAGRGFRQQLAGIRPGTAPQDFDPMDGSGTRVTLIFDPMAVGPGFILPADLDHFDLHGPDCSAPAGPGWVVLRDLRRSESGRDVLYH